MLPDFGWTELLLIAIVLIVVVGPKDLPRVVRGFSKTLGNMRKMAGDFRKQFDDALTEAELDDLKTLASDVKSMDPRNSIKEALNPLSEVGQDINDELKGIKLTVEGKDLPDPVIEPPKKVVTPDEHYPQLAKMRKEREAEAAAKAAEMKKTAAKKPAAKKPAAKKTAAKTPTAKKPVSAKATTAKKPAPRAAAAKKTQAAKKTTAAKTVAKKPAAKAGGKA